jgi:uncharacterized cupin superfamily protein
MDEMIVKKPSDAELIESSFWEIWEKDKSEFDYSYDSIEKCVILEGCAMISYSDKNIEIKKGDLVIFPKGFFCTWKITSKIVKKYKFF